MLLIHCLSRTTISVHTQKSMVLGNLIRDQSDRGFDSSCQFDQNDEFVVELNIVNHLEGIDTLLVGRTRSVGRTRRKAPLVDSKKRNLPD